MSLIHEVAPLLYGPHWQTPLAEALGVTRRTVQRWAAEEWEPRPKTWEKVLDLIVRRFAQLGVASAQVALAIHQQERLKI